jgi:hypothetical protein
MSYPSFGQGLSSLSRLPSGLRFSASLLAAPLLLGSLVAAPQAPAHASTINPALQSITPGTVGGNPGFTGTLGYSFTLTKPYAVTSLGFYDDLDDGLLSPHMVGIFDANTQALLVSATLPSGTATVLQNNFRWLTVPEFVLAPGSYVMGATSSGDPTTFDPFLFDGFDPVVSGGFSLDGPSLSESGSGTVVAFPTVDEGVPYGFFGANMAGHTPAPGPLPLLGAASALAWSRKMRRRLGAGRTLPS